MHSLHGNGLANRATKGQTKGKGKGKSKDLPSQSAAVFGKGKGSEAPATDHANSSAEPFVSETDPKIEAERLFKEQMLAALPSHLSANTPQLVAEEWNTRVVSAHELGAHAAWP